MIVPEAHKRAPDSEVLLSDGTRHALSDFWKEKPLLLVFLRHFGWPFCRKQVVQLHNAREEFRENGFNVLLVGLGTEEQAQKFRKEFSLTFPIVCDPRKDLYRLFDLKGGTVADVASPAILLKGLRAMSLGYRPGIPQADVMQLPGVFLIDTDGNIRYSYFSKDASDHPSVETLLGLSDLFIEPSE